MKFGTLRIRFLDGTDRDFPLELPSGVVGRGEGVSILIDDFSISRRHAALTVESSRLLVEDLGSAAGTFLNGERLAPHTRYLVDEGVELRFGDLEAVYLPPPPTEAPISAEEEGALPGGLHVALISPALPVDAGKQVTATLTITNRSRIVDDIVLSIPELPAEWYTISNPRFSLVPNAREEVQIVIHPPRRHDSQAGEYDFAVHIDSREQEREFIAAGSFTVLPYESASINLSAMRAKRDFKVVAENSGNAPITIDLAGRDDEQAFRYRFASPAVELQPGEKAIVPLRVDRKRQLFGPPSQPFFETVGKFRDSGSEITARGQLAINPPLEKFKMPTLLLLGAIILAFTAIAILIVADGDGVETAGAESEYAGVHLCDDGGAQAQDSDADSASAGTPRPDATIAGDGSGGTAVFGNADSEGAPFFAQNDPRWADTEYARSTELPAGKDWCGTTIAQCGCAMTSVGVMLALYGILELPDGNALNPQTLNAWFNGKAKRTERGWVSRGYIYGDVIWAAANAISGEIAKANPGTPTVRFVRKGTGSEDEIRAELRAGRPVILEVPGHWIAAVGLDGDTILINDPFYRDRTTLDVYAGKVRSSVIYEPSNDLSAVVLTAPSDVKFRVIDSQGRVVDTGSSNDEADAVIQIPGASVDNRRAWRDPTCIEEAPPPGAGTHQIVLPGSPDDYTIEILDTGGQPGSVAVHTYGRDGSSSIETIDTAGAATAELSVDPETGTSDVEVTSGGTPTPQTTPTPGEQDTGDEETPTPTIEPTQGPPPTPTPTPFEEATTNITLGAEAGQTRVETASNEGFELGDPIRFAPGQPNEEDNIIVGFGSMLLATPLKFAHGPGEVIERLPRPPGQGPGLPPGITPPPDTGPLEPPTTVGLACSTLYQPSPKLATFICDLQVTGEYTTTRWTLNGETVQEFTGSNSFLMTFPEDTPASISASVCNVTICRSVSRQEQIDFGTGLGSQGSGTNGSGGSGTNGGSTTGPAPTPVPQGQVVVVCQTSFEINEITQIARITCQASFSGDYTSIAWSAPGGQPANQSGISKEFTTSIVNELGSPTSLSITATVCDFGRCATSEPQRVGIGQTRTIIDTDPHGSVPLRHSVTLFAVVAGLEGVVPQGGNVQFFADDLPISPSAALFTVGSLSVAQITVQTGGAAGLTTEGDHTIRAVYSGGINAFGSTSDTANFTIDPPIPDGCDSIDGDPPAAGPGITDDTCDFGTPKSLGAGTILNSLSISGGTQDGVDNAVIVGPGDQFTVSGSAGRTDYCPGCIRQVYLGIGGYDLPLPHPTESDQTVSHPNRTALGPTCVLSATMPLSPDGRRFDNVTMTAPSVPGVYYIRASTTLDFFCVGPQVAPADRSVGRLIVRDTVITNIEVLQFNGTDAWDDTNAPHAPVGEVEAGDRVLVRAFVPPGATGRVDIVGFGTTALAAPVCPPSGSVTTTSGQRACTPGEARVLSPVLTGTQTLLSINGKYENPSPTQLIDPETGTPDDYAFYLSPAGPPSPTTSNTVNLVVLAGSETSLEVEPSGDIPVCQGSCSEVVLTATVDAIDSDESAQGGVVRFEKRSEPFPTDPESGWSSIGCDAVAVGANDEAVCTLQTDDTDEPGDFQFRAGFSRGDPPPVGTPDTRPRLTDSTSVPELVEFVRAASSVTVATSPSGPIIGDVITLTATVVGGGGFSPFPGTVTFRRDNAAGPIIGSAVAVNEDDCLDTACTVSLEFTTGSSPLADATTYDVVATYSGNDDLDADTSNAVEVVIDQAEPTLTLSFPDGATQTVGTSALVRAVLSNPGSTNPNRFNDNGATILFEDSDGTDLATVAVSNISGVGWGAQFNTNGLDADTYEITATYGGNNYFGTAVDGPETLTISQIVPNVTIDAGQTSDRQIGQTITLAADVTGSGITSPEGGTVTFFSDGIEIGTDEVDSNGRAVLATQSSGDGTNFPTVGGYDITAKFEGDADNDNVAESAVSDAEVATFTTRTPTVTMPNASAVLGSSVSLTATVSSGSANVSPACTSCLQFQIDVGGTWTDIGLPASVSLVGVNYTASLSVATGVVPFQNNGTYDVRARYNNPADIAPANLNVNLATDDDGATVTVGPPPPTVSVGGVAFELDGSGNLVATVTPPGGVAAPGTSGFRNPSCSSCLTFRVRTGPGANDFTSIATVSVSWSSGASQYRGSTTISGGSTAFPDVGSYEVFAVYAPSGGTGASGPADDVGGPATSPDATVDVNPITVSITVSAPSPRVVGQSTTILATLDPDTATGTVQFFKDDAEFGAPVDVDGGEAEIAWIPDAVDTGVVFRAEYTSDSGDFAHQTTSTTATVVINQATPSVQITSTNSPVTAGTNLTFNVSVGGSGATSPAGGTVTLFIGSTAGTNLGTSAAVAADGTVTLSIPTGASTNLPASGTAYSIVARFNGNATNGNVGQATSTAVNVTVNAPPP